VSQIKIKRSDPIYIEIENFKDYELTNNIAYEMAIRNEKVRQLKEQYELESEKNATKSKEDFLERMHNGKLESELEEEIEYEIRHKYFITHFNGYQDPEYSKTLLYPSLKGYIMMPDENGKYEDTRILSENISVAAKLTPDFSRPLMLPPECLDKRLPFFLNLSLSEDELLAYIHIIKRRFEKDHKNITTLAEIFGENFFKSDPSVTVGKQVVKSLGVISHQIKAADMLYAYDAAKLEIPYMDIQYDMDEYHTGNERKEKTFSPNTAKKYLQIARDYIDNLRYKELVTGVSY
jgi:hypothetical protein